MDETGFMIGVGSNKLVITKRKRAAYFGVPINRESATAIEAISAGGTYIPAFLILSGHVHNSQWYRISELLGDTCVATSATGFTNDVLTLRWLEHFERHTRQQTVGAYRLLICDGYGSHHTKEFIEFCDAHNIIPIGLPSHTTHLLQPLDVSCFQPLKHYHSKAINAVIRDGCTKISKLEFLTWFQQIRVQTFKKSTILSGFRQCGIHPFNPDIVLEEVEARVARFTTPEPEENSAEPSSSPFGTPYTPRKLERATGKFMDSLLASPCKARAFERIMRGSMVQATENHETKYALGMTEAAALARRNRSSKKKNWVQQGGVLSVENAREMVEARDADDEAEAVRKAYAVLEKDKRYRQRVANEAAKVARSLYIDGTYGPTLICDGKGPGRLLKRF